MNRTQKTSRRTPMNIWDQKEEGGREGCSIIKISWPIQLNDLWSKKICEPKMIVWSGAAFILRRSCSYHTKFIPQAKAHFQRKGVGALEEYFPCKDCGKNFNSAQLLKDHVRVHQKKHQCDQCSLAMPTPSTLKTHIKYAHLKERLESCSMCKYKGKTVADIRSHMKTHDKNRSKVICRHGCGFAKMSKKAVEDHYVKAHGQKREKFGCHLCDYVFSQGTHVTKHLQKVHGDVKVGLTRNQFKKGVKGIFYMTK